MTTIKDLCEQKIILNKNYKKYYKILDSRDSQIQRKYVIYNILDEDFCGMAIFALIMFVALPCGFISLLLAAMIAEYIPEINGLYLFIGSFLISFFSIASTLSYNGYKEEQKNKNIYQKYKSQLDEITDKYNSLKKIYEKDLMLLEFDIIDISLKKINKLNKIEKEVIKDLKEVLKNTDDYDIIETIKKKNELNKKSTSVIGIF